MSIRRKSPRGGGLTWAREQAAKYLTRGHQLRSPRRPPAPIPSLGSPNGRCTPAWPRASERAPPGPHPFLRACDQSGVGPRRCPALARCPRFQERTDPSAHDPAAPASLRVCPLPGSRLWAESCSPRPGVSLLGMCRWTNHLGIPFNLPLPSPVPHS